MDQDGEKTRAEPLHQKGLRLCILFRLVRTSLILTLFPIGLGGGFYAAIAINLPRHQNSIQFYACAHDKKLIHIA
jgi:hypothetical protein